MTSAKQSLEQTFGFFDAACEGVVVCEPELVANFCDSEFLVISLERCNLRATGRRDLPEISSTIPPSPAGQPAGIFSIPVVLRKR
jgi:hypothetical protein